MLPEKWCIKLTKENFHIVGNYYDQKTRNTDDPTYGTLNAVGKYLSSHETNGNRCYVGAEKGSGGDKHYSSFFCSSYDTEITTEDFIKYVLRQEPKETIYEIF